MGRCSICGGQEIFLTSLGEVNFPVELPGDNFLLTNNGLPWCLRIGFGETFLTGCEELLRVTEMLGFVDAWIGVSPDISLLRFEVGFVLSWRELRLGVFLKPGLTLSFPVGGGSVTEILRREPDKDDGEEDKCSDELDNCFVIGRFKSEDTFLVQAACLWELFTSRPFKVF